MSAAEAIEFETTPEEESEASAGVLATAGKARDDLIEFFSFVIREETTRARIVATPHQRVALKFVDEHDRCVFRFPAGFSKTYLIGTLALSILGNDPTERGAFISATRDQASKPLDFVKKYIKSSAELSLVFPGLIESTDVSDKWTQTSIVVERPPGIRDPSIACFGVDGALPGSRLSFIFIDDILNQENTQTQAQRDHVFSWLGKSVFSRRDVQPVGSTKRTKILVTNTVWHEDDVTKRLEKEGWPTLEMDIDGNIYIFNAPDFDCDEIRPSDSNDYKEGIGPYRLSDHDDPDVARACEVDVPEGVTEWRDTDDQVPLWPGKYGPAAKRELLDIYKNTMHIYNMVYKNRVRDEETARIKIEWIDSAKAKARENNVFTFTNKVPSDVIATFTGLDPAFSERKKKDKSITSGSGAMSALFTFGVRKDYLLVPLLIDVGKWGGSTLMDRIMYHHDTFESIVRVETNGSQKLLKEWALERKATIRVKSHNTGKNKWDPRFGLESGFVELENGAWLIPNEVTGETHQWTQMWIDAMIHFNPNVHTPDVLMAWWLAREQARHSGFLKSYHRQPKDFSIAAVVGAR